MTPKSTELIALMATPKSTELIALMAASMCREPGSPDSREYSVDNATCLLREVESRQPPVEAPETPSAAYAQGKSDGFEAALDEAIAAARKLKAGWDDDFNYCDESTAAAQIIEVIEALKSKPSQAAEGEKKHDR